MACAGESGSAAFLITFADSGMKTKAFIFSVLAMLLFAAAADARRLRTTRKPLKAIETECPQGAVPDTTVSALIVTAEEGRRQAVRLFGYEKTVNATRETVFVENLTGQPVTAVSFTIRYLDADGRMIHQRTVSRHRVNIPAGEIRRIDIRSWDTQRTHYYVGGPRPRRNAKPFDVTLTADSVSFSVACDSQNAPD